MPPSTEIDRIELLCGLTSLFIMLRGRNSHGRWTTGILDKHPILGSRNVEMGVAEVNSSKKQREIMPIQKGAWSQNIEKKNQLTKLIIDYARNNRDIGSHQ